MSTKDKSNVFKEFFILENIKDRDKKYKRTFLAVGIFYLIILGFLLLHQIFNTKFLLFSDFGIEMTALYGLVIAGLVTSFLSYNKGEMALRKLSLFEGPLEFIFYFVLVIQFPFDMTHSGDYIPIIGPLINAIPNALLYLVLVILLIIEVLSYLLNLWIYSEVTNRLKKPEVVAAKLKIMDSISDESTKSDSDWYEES